jgi:hypothetical protein
MFRKEEKLKKLTSILSALAMVGGIMTTESVPAYSAPFAPVTIETGSANFQQVQYRRHWRGGWNGDRYWHRGRGWGGGPYWGGGGWGGGPYWGGGGGWGGDPYWGGRYRYGGYRYYRPGYRYYDGAWIPLAAFGTGLIIGNALSGPVYRAPVYSAGGSHVRWCYNRYRSYRAYDNTYQPYYGPRRQCISPY